MAQVAYLRQVLRAWGGRKILQILHASQLLAKPNIVIFQNLGHTKFCYNFFAYIFIIIIITNIMQYTFSFFCNWYVYCPICLWLWALLINYKLNK